MPEKKTIRKAQKDKQEGKAASTQAGEFVHEEIEHIREGKHGAKNTKQAIAIGLSKARRAGVDIPSSPGRKASPSESKHKGRIASHKTSKARSEAGERRLKGESSNVVSHKALSKQTKKSAGKRTSHDRHEAAMKAVKTKGKAGLKRAAKKAAHTREEHLKAA